MAEPRWLADEMLGRLARYLRFMGFDTEYVRGLPDEEIRARAVREGRTLLTRDRELARRTSGSIELRRVDIDGQLAELRRARPGLRWEVRADRCTACNGLLETWRPSDARPNTGPAPPDWSERGLVLYGCPACGQIYWEGTHASAIRARIARVAANSGA